MLQYKIKLKNVWKHPLCPAAFLQRPLLTKAGIVPVGMAQLVKNLPAVQETWVPSLGREDSPGEGNGKLLQYSCLENPMDRGA